MNKNNVTVPEEEIDEALALRLRGFLGKIKEYMAEADERMQSVEDRKVVQDLRVSFEGMKAEFRGLVKELSPYLDGKDNVLVRLAAVEKAVGNLEGKKGPVVTSAAIVAIVEGLRQLLPFLQQLLASSGKGP